MVDLKNSSTREAIEQLYFGYRALTEQPDRILERKGLGRVHHRILYFVGRSPSTTVNALLSTLNVSKQALNTPLRQLIEMDKNWIPSKEDHSLYIRPFMFSSDELLGVRPSETYKFMIILGPSGAYFSAPMKILIEQQYTRATPGGVGFAKNGGNYGASLYPVSLAQAKGYDQVLWTDAIEHKYVEEVGMMNVMFVIDGKVITPSVEKGTVLKGVTRNSAITLLREMGYEVEERFLSVAEIVDAHKKGLFQEVFGVGTAAVVSYISRLAHGEYIMDFDIEALKVAPALKKHLNDIRMGNIVDKHDWLVHI